MRGKQKEKKKYAHAFHYGQPQKVTAQHWLSEEFLSCTHYTLPDYKANQTPTGHSLEM